MLWLLLKGVLIGLGAAAPLGPVNVELARRTLRGGFGAGFALGIGAVTVDVAYAVLTTLSVGRFLDRPAVAGPLAVGSVGVLSYLGVGCLRSAWHPAADDPAAAVPARPRNGYAAGVLMTLVNPLTLAFWFTALPAVAGPIAPRGLALVAVGVFAGTTAWVTAFAGTLAVVGRFHRGAWVRAVDAAGGATLIVFALAAFLRSVRPLL